LASDDADYILGASLFVDGGMTLYPSFEAGVNPRQGEPGFGLSRNLSLSQETPMRFVRRLAMSVVLALTLRTAASAQEPVALKIAAPELRGIEPWINSKPLTLTELRGKVVVLHFWTFG
jgi:hypothetical protein